METAALSVSELTARIKIVLEGGLPVLWVRGEISQFTSHRSGHIYFTLIDEQSQLPCVLWRGRAEALTFQSTVGEQVLALGKVVVYERGGRYQFDCLELRPAGVGDLARAFEELKRKLAQEGLFDANRKIPLPPYPERIGLVTSPEGAALQDILKVASQQAPWVEFQLVPVHVQGSSAAREIAAGIKWLDDSGWPQVIIAGRGGGAPEDLWAFNEAVVVRAIAQCRTPLVSAVGHEVDVTLADLAADLRAPTPSAAAEMVLPDREALQKRLKDSAVQLRRRLLQRFSENKRWLSDHVSVIMQNSMTNLWRETSQKTDELTRRLEITVALGMERRSARLKQSEAKHLSLNPLSILARGYSIVRKAGQSQPITDSASLSPEEAIDIAFHRGQASATIVRTETN